MRSPSLTRAAQGLFSITLPAAGGAVAAAAAFFAPNGAHDRNGQPERDQREEQKVKRLHLQEIALAARYASAAITHAIAHWNTATSAPRHLPPSSRPMAAIAATQGV